MSEKFIHLNVHSEYSVTEGIVRIDELLNHAVENEVPAVAITDTNNLFSAIKLYCGATARGIKPIIGCELAIGNKRHAHPAVFLCRDNTGYANLINLVSKAYTREADPGFAKPIISAEYDWVAEHNEGLIVLSGGAQGDIGTALLEGNEEEAVRRMNFWTKTFGDRFYIELRNLGRDSDTVYLSRVLGLASREGIPAAASNRVCFLEKKHFRAHVVRTCIANSEQLNDVMQTHSYTEEQYFKDDTEMRSLFKACPEAIDNAIEIAKRCTVSMDLEQVRLPTFPVEGAISEDDYLRKQAEDKLAAYFESKKFDADGAQVYTDRLNHELAVITRMGYAGYFLIVADFIRWAREHGIPVGPGRGSGAGSLVAYLIGITEINPIPYGLLFERFLNPERVSMPDFDIDFCAERRDEVIQYVFDFYGKDKSSQIITFGTMAARAVVRDVARVMGWPYVRQDQLAKLIPDRLEIKLSEALQESEELKTSYKQDDKVKEVIDLALELEGIVRNVGCHAGGVVISPKLLTHFSAIYRDTNLKSLNVMTQLDMKDLEKIGLVKFDFLGLKTLTVLDKAVKAIRATDPDFADLKELALDDHETYHMVQQGRTVGVFQLESEGMRRLLCEFKPNSFNDIVALLALFRPGPLQSGMVKDFVQRKHGADIVYPHPKLKPVLESTYGVILYQEQVMEIAQILAGYTMGGADILRRAMGKKNPEEMAQQRKVFVGNAVEKGLRETQASSIFSLMENFAGYGFNKSHSVAYAMIAYQTAWLKTHYSVSFMAALMSTEMANTTKMITLLHECRSLGVEVKRPDINHSEWDCVAEGDKAIRYGLGAIPNLGSKLAQKIVDDRINNGEYKSLEDFCARAVANEVRSGVAETLVRAGTLDALIERAAAIKQLPAVYAMAERSWKDANLGQDALFSGEPQMEAVHIEMQEVEPMAADKIFEMERATLGLYIGHHPLDAWRQDLGHLGLKSLHAFKQNMGSESSVCSVVGVITNVSRKRSKNRPLAVFAIDDGTGRLDFVLGGSAYEEYEALLVSNSIVVVEVGVHRDKGSGWVSRRARKIQRIDDVRKKRGRGLTIQVDADAASEDFCATLYRELECFTEEGQCPVNIDFHRARSRAKLELGEQWKIAVSNDLLERLRRIEGVREVRVQY